jgi:hypothetical protein
MRSPEEQRAYEAMMEQLRRVDAFVSYFLGRDEKEEVRDEDETI